jgi:hypothetical protein
MTKSLASVVRIALSTTVTDGSMSLHSCEHRAVSCVNHPSLQLLSELFNRALAAGVPVNTELITEFATAFSKHNQQQQFAALLEQALTGTVTVAGHQLPVVLVKSKTPLEQALAQLKSSV